MAKESICRNCFHSYVCEQFNENKDDNNKKCHFLNDHYVPIADVVPKSEVDRLTNILDSYALQYGTVMDKHIVIEKARQEVAREIFEEIEKLSNVYQFPKDAHRVLDESDYAELKKKYTEEGK